MGVTCRQVTFIVIQCDLCRVVEHRAHEARQEGDMASFLEAHRARAEKSLPRGWATLKGDKDKHVCLKCAREIRGE